MPRRVPSHTARWATAWTDGLGLTAVAVLEDVARPPTWTVGEKGYFEHDREYFPCKRPQPQQMAAEAAQCDEHEAGG